jgi:hypothetical protein
MSVKPTTPSSPLMKNAASAPMVYFDNVPVFGVFAGNLEVELAARMLMPKADGNVFADMACTAHLRCSPGAAIALVDALTKALDMHKAQHERPSDLLRTN